LTALLAVQKWDVQATVSAVSSISDEILLDWLVGSEAVQYFVIVSSTCQSTNLDSEVDNTNGIYLRSDFIIGNIWSWLLMGTVEVNAQHPRLLRKQEEGFDGRCNIKTNHKPFSSFESPFSSIQSSLSAFFPLTASSVIARAFF